MKFGIKVLERGELPNVEPLLVNPGEVYTIDVNDDGVVITISPNFDGVAVYGVGKVPL